MTKPDALGLGWFLLEMKMETVKLVEVLPTKIWSEKDMLGTVNIKLQHEGLGDPFCIVQIHYDYRYTTNAHQHELTQRILVLLGADVPKDVDVEIDSAYIGWQAAQAEMQVKIDGLRAAARYFDLQREEFEKRYAGASFSHSEFGYLDRDIQELYLYWCVAQAAMQIDGLREYITQLESVSCTEAELQTECERLLFANSKLETANLELAAQLKALREPFGYWHQGDTEEESDFHLFKDVPHSDKDCGHCIPLYAKTKTATTIKKAVENVEHATK